MRWQIKLLTVLIIISMALVSCGTKSTIEDENTQQQQQTETKQEDKKVDEQKPEDTKVEEDKTETKVEEQKPAVNEKKASDATEKINEKQKKLVGVDIKDIYFAFDSDVLTDLAQDLLKKKYDWLKENPDVMIEIQGHCDERGTTSYNIALGQKRAERTKEFLINMGIEASRITTVSFGEEFASKAKTEAAWAKDRKAHFKQK